MAVNRNIYSWHGLGGVDAATLHLGQGQIDRGWDYFLELLHIHSIPLFKPDGVWIHLPFGTEDDAAMEWDAFLLENSAGSKLRDERSFVQTFIHTNKILAAAQNRPQQAIRLGFYFGNPYYSTKMHSLWEDGEFTKWRDRAVTSLRPVLTLKSALPKGCEIMLGVDSAGSGVNGGESHAICDIIESLGLTPVIESRPWLESSNGCEMWGNRKSWPSLTTDSYWDTNSADFVPYADLLGETQVLCIQGEGVVATYEAAVIDSLSTYTTGLDGKRGSAAIVSIHAGNIDISAGHDANYFREQAT